MFDKKGGVPPSPVGSPDEDSSYMDDIMSEPLEGEGEGEDMFAGDPLEEALSSAGFKVDPATLDQIRALVEKKPGKPELGKEDPLGGMGMGAGAPPAGGAVPSGMKMGDLAR